MTSKIDRFSKRSSCRKPRASKFLPTANTGGISSRRISPKPSMVWFPGKTTVSFEWRGAGSELAKESKEGNLQFIVGAKLRKKGRFTPGEAPFLKQHAPGPFKVCTPAAMQHAISRYKPGVTDKVYPTIHDMLQDVAMIMRGRGSGIDR